MHVMERLAVERFLFISNKFVQSLPEPSQLVLWDMYDLVSWPPFLPHLERKYTLFPFLRDASLGKGHCIELF